MIKKLLQPYKEKSILFGVSKAYLAQIAIGHRRMPCDLAIKVHLAYGTPLWKLRPDVYPRELFEAKNEE